MHEAKKSRRLAIVLSVLVIVCCVSLIIGSTFAMFSANKQFPFNVSGGKIDIDAALTLDHAFSVSGDDEGDRTEYTQRGEDGSVTIGTGNPGDSGYFGKVSVSADENADDNIVSNVSMEGLARGAGAQFTLSVTNNSTVGMKFIAYLEKGNGDFAAALDVTPVVTGDGSAAYTVSGTRVIFTRGNNNETWQSGGENGAKTDFSFEVYLPWANTDTLSGGLETMNIVIEAVQSNADTAVTVDTGNGEESYSTFEEALEAANNAESATATVKAGDGTHNIPENFVPNKPLTIEGNGDGTVINGDIKTNDDLTLKNATYNGNITSNGGSVNVETATINGAINYTGTADASAGTFSALAKVSRGNAVRAEVPAITLTNATVEVENLSYAIYVKDADLRLENCTVTLNTNVGANTVWVDNGSAEIVNTDITVNATGAASAALYVKSAADDTVTVSSSSLVVNTKTLGNGYGIQADTVTLNVSDSYIAADYGIYPLNGASVTVSGGEILGHVAAISTNNTTGEATITVTDGAYLWSDNDFVVLYLPSQRSLTIDGGATVKGYTPVQVRMGTITIREATLISTATENAEIEYYSDINTDGSVLQLDTHSYEFEGGNDLTVYINKGAQLVTQNEEVRRISMYDWDKCEQNVLIVDGTQEYSSEIVGLAANAEALQRLITQNYCRELILLADTETAEGIEFNFNSDVATTLDLNGKKLVGTNAGATITNYGGILTITGNGTVYSTNVENQYRHAVLNRDTLIIENGTFGSSQSRGCAVNNFGTATINGGNFTACDNYVNGGYAYAIVNGDGTMTIHDAHVYGHMNGAISADGGTLTVNGGTYELTEKGTATNLFYMVYTWGSGQVVINDGTFTRDVANDFGFFYQANAEGKIIVNGGTFEDLRRDYINIAGAGQVEINGGNFVDVPRVTSNAVFVTFGFSLKGETVTDPTLMSIQAYLNAKADLVFTDPIVIPKGQSFTIVANGSTLTGTIINHGTLTITGKGTITNAADDKNHTITNYGTLIIGKEGVADDESITVDNLTHATAAVHNDVGATFTLNSGKLLRTNEAGADEDNSGGNSFYNLRNYGKVIINGGTIEQTGHFSSLVENGWYDGTQNTQQAEAVMIINGGTFSGGINTIKNDDWGVMTINDGTFVNMTQHAVLNWNVVEITGGSFTAKEGAVAILCNGYLNDTMDKGQMIVTGGSFNTMPVFMANGTPAGGMIVVNSEALYDAASAACAGTQMAVYCFVGGDGSESNPFGIAGEAQLEAVRAISALAATSLDADAWYANLSYALTQDVTVGKDFSTLRYFNGKLDGKEHTLDLSAMGGAFSEDAFGNLTFKNITFVLSGNIASYVNWTNGSPNSWLMYGTDVLFEDVVTKTAEGAYLGDQSLLGSNIGAFISQIFNGSDLTFRNCTNYADIYARYGAPFIGGYASNCTVTFENCVNYGDVHADGAAMLVGNANQYSTSDYTVTDCVNYGTISGMSHAGLDVGFGGASYDNNFTGEQLKNGTAEDGVSGQIISTGVTVTVNVANDGTISANYTDEGSNAITKAIVYLYGYVYVYQEGNINEQYGTALTYFDQQEIELTDADSAVISGITLKRLPVYDGRTAGFVPTGDSDSTPGGIDKGTLNGNDVYYISEEFSFGGFENIGDAAYAASSSGTSMTPTVAVFLYAGDQVVGIGV